MEMQSFNCPWILILHQLLPRAFLPTVFDGARNRLEPILVKFHNKIYLYTYSFKHRESFKYMGPVVTASIFAFTLVILLLVFILLYAQHRLVQSGDVTIVINGDRDNPLVTNAGSTLLSTLSSQKIFLPSACGGGGTCAMCKCTIEEGGGEVLPTEVGHLSRSEQKEKVRLACQVKVKQDMIIRIPEEIFGIKK